MQKVIKITLIFLLIINVLYVFAGVLYHPLQSIDSIGIWLFKAKAFYIEHGFPNDFLHNTQYAYSHQSYPLGLPFLIFLVYTIIGGIHERVILLFYPIMYAAILFITYKVIRRGTTPLLALLFTYTYSMFGTLIAGGGRILAGGADIILVLIEWLILFIMYKKELTYKRYIFIILLIMLASQIKLEGAFPSLLLLFCPLKWRTKIIAFGISLLPCIGWMLTIYILKIPSDTHAILPSIPLLFERIIFIAVGISKELVNVNNWYIFWIILFVSLCTKTKISQQMRHIFIPAYLAMITMYILVYIFASNDTYTYVTSSFDRVLLQQSAIIFLLFSEKMNMILKNKIKKNKTNYFSIFFT